MISADVIHLNLIHRIEGSAYSNLLSSIVKKQEQQTLTILKAGRADES